jgi:hypothetical protein
MPKWFNEEESIKKKANKKESKVYKHLVSGALSYKGDFSDENAVMDNKSTEKKSISVTEKMCKKLIEDALTRGKEHSVLILDLPNYYLVCNVKAKGEL